MGRQARYIVEWVNKLVDEYRQIKLMKPHYSRYVEFYDQHGDVFRAAMSVRDTRRALLKAADVVYRCSTPSRCLMAAMYGVHDGPPGLVYYGDSIEGDRTLLTERPPELSPPVRPGRVTRIRMNRLGSIDDSWDNEENAPFAAAHFNCRHDSQVLLWEDIYKDAASVYGTGNNVIVVG